MFTFFKRSFFFGRISLKQIEEQKYGTRVSGGMTPERFKNLDTVMAF